MKLLFISSGVVHGYAYPENSIYEIEDSLAGRFIRLKIAIQINDDFEPIPDNFPYKMNFFQANVFSFDQLKKLPENHSLSDTKSSNTYGLNFPKTKKLLQDFSDREKGIFHKPKKDITY